MGDELRTVTAGARRSGPGGGSGYIGARSVKWVTGITVQPRPSDNYFQATAYRILPPDADPDTAGPGDGICCLRSR